VVGLGGLHILVTEAFTSPAASTTSLPGPLRRPGATPGFVQVLPPVPGKTTLMRIFPRATGFAKADGTRFGVQENEPIEHPWLNQGHRGRPRRGVEGQNFDHPQETLARVRRP